MRYVAHPQGCQEVLGGGGIHDESQHHYTSTVEQDLCVCVCRLVVREVFSLLVFHNYLTFGNFIPVILHCTHSFFSFTL